MKFNFAARTKEGRIQAGVIEASTKEAAIDILKSQELFVSSIEEAYTPLYAKRLVLFDRVSNKDLVLFSRQLSILLKSQVPVAETLETLARQMKNRAFKEKIEKIREAVQGGIALSEALSVHSKIFSNFYINMVKSGEASGRVTDTLVYLADYLEKEYKFRSKVRGALTYPIFIVFVFIIVAGLIVGFIVPQLSEILKETQGELPLITRIVMGAADFIIKWWWLGILGIVVLVISILALSRTKDGKRFFDKFLLSLPVLGVFLKKIFLSRFAMNLSTLVSGGIPIVASLEIAANIVGNEVYKDIIGKTKEGIKKGETMSSVLENYPAYIFPLFSQMVQVGEKTGTLDSSLKNVVNFYEDDVNRTLEDFLKLLEPILIIFLGGTVGVLIGAVLLPIYSAALQQ